MSDSPYATPRAALSGAPADEEPKSNRAPWILLGVFAGAVFLGYLAYPNHEEYRMRARVSEGILAATEIKKKIDDRLLAGTPPQSVGAGLRLPQSIVIKGGSVAENGSIYVVFEEPPAVLTMTIANFDPVSRKAAWHCLGWPAKVMPLSCREQAR